MSQLTTPLTLEAFLTLPETKPASEFINGAIVQKPMPQGEHSRLQGKLCAEINRVAEPKKLACAFPELRCVFGGDAIVPDIAIFQWERIPRTASGRIANRFDSSPDWAIEILSPEQSQNKVLGKLLHCSQSGTELGWMVDPEDESVLIVFPEQRVQLLKGDRSLPVLSQIELSLTANQVFGWLAID
ncbi:Uma2 family endonuclease [Leptolyngbya ohadii]|uniref:Uma2 family endonuclease n=1 Tax=Leptolyngbya ohadii TaxID=1962290 RepID=UPI000B59A5F9|nr:Uma2 family endonuclease [Leptolyngbya ohadii]